MEAVWEVRKDSETIFLATDGDYYSKDPDPLLPDTFRGYYVNDKLVCFENLITGEEEIWDQSGLSIVESMMDAVIEAGKED
jgi:hypothetical protein